MQRNPHNGKLDRRQGVFYFQQNICQARGDEGEPVYLRRLRDVNNQNVENIFWHWFKETALKKEHMLARKVWKINTLHCIYLVI